MRWKRPSPERTIVKPREADAMPTTGFALGPTTGRSEARYRGPGVPSLPGRRRGPGLVPAACWERSGVATVRMCTGRS